MFEALGVFVYRHRWLTLALCGVFLVVSALLLLRGGRITSGTIRDLEADAAQRLADRVPGAPNDTTFVAVFLDDQKIGEEALLRGMKDALAPLASDARVLSVTTPDVAPPPMRPRMVAADGQAAFALVSLAGDFDQALEAYPHVRARIRPGELDMACTGKIAFVYDLDRTLERDLLRAELVSLPLALLVLLLVFRTVVAAALPVGVGALAVAGGIAVMLGLSNHLDTPQYTLNVCSLLGLGVAIDYSLFMVARYREELAAGHAYREALIHAVAGAGKIVAFSGLAVATGLGGLLFYEGGYLMSMGIGGAVVVALAVFFALTFLPALLAVLGPRIHAGRLRAAPRKGAVGFWHRMATTVMRRPLRFLIPTLAVLLLLGVPFLHLRLAVADVHVLPPEVESRRGYQLLGEHFPDEVANRIVVAVRFPDPPALRPDRIGALYDLSRRARALPGVRQVDSIVDVVPGLTREQAQALVPNPPPELAPAIELSKRLTVGADVAVLQVITDHPPESRVARSLVDAIRADRRVADGELLVGGPTANDVDTNAYIVSRTPRAVAFIIGVTLVVLALMLGSIVLPIKAVAMNFVSIAGSFGALVWVFQDGHLFVREPRPLDPSLPVLLFCILFGLSMDYEVLMLSRMKEAYDETRDNTHAVADGLEKTGGLITSAAAIMVAVFGAFALADVVLIQAVGFGMAVAVALDATLVRVLLVPATMRLFGDLNWWAPRPLVALRRRLGLDRSGRAP
jgi:uncharacterized membrane protein YdfJ with MMPL/SSD domain